MSTNNYEDKSDITFDSAEMLHRNNKNNSSIHGYYYSCLQLINNFIVKNCKYTEAELLEKAKCKDSHNEITNIVKDYFHSNNINPINLFSELNIIKKQRVKDDYEMQLIIKSEADVVRSKTIYFRKQLKQFDNEI
jgi:hypothetical protein